MPEELSIPIWSKGINFKVYKFDKDIEYEELIKSLAKYKGSIDKKTKGWIIDTPYLNKYGENEACIIFMSFNKDANPSRLYQMDILKTDPIGFIFDFKDKLIIASTANRQKLASIIEANAFIPIRDITRVEGYSYSGDFLFWLVHNFDTNNGEITKDIKIEDFEKPD